MKEGCRPLCAATLATLLLQSTNENAALALSFPARRNGKGCGHAMEKFGARRFVSSSSSVLIGPSVTGRLGQVGTYE